MNQLPPIPTFETWERENLVQFCIEASNVIKVQRELIRLYRARVLIDSDKSKENDDARKTD